MLTALQEAQQKFAALDTEYQTLAGKGNALTPEDWTRMEALVDGDMPAARDAIAQAKKQTDLLGRGATLSQWGSDLPGRALPTGSPVPDSVPLAAPGEQAPDAPAGLTSARVLPGTQQDISKLFPDGRGGWEMESRGGGVMSQKQWAHISSKEYGNAFMAYVLKQGMVEALSREHRLALEEGIDTAGGYLSPPEWVAMIVKREPGLMGVADYCFGWDTVRDRVHFPALRYAGNNSDDPNAVLYTSGVRVTYVGESPSTSTAIDSTEPSYGELEIPVHTAMGALSVTNNLLEDSPLMVQSYLTDAFSEAVRLEYDRIVIKGTGVGQGAGMIRSPVSSATGTEPQYIVSGDANHLTADGIKSLLFSIAPQYWANTRFLMNWMSAAQEIDKLKDGDGNYLWSMGVQDNRLSASPFDRLLQGRPVTYSEWMPAVAAGTFPVVFGNLMGEIIVRRLGMTIQVLRETKAKQNQIELVLRFRFGAKVIRPWQIRTAKVSA